jgi:D-threo-aldose 1-dehydrogenase
MRSYEDSLQRMGLSRIDILLLHDIGAMQHGEEANRAYFKDAMTGGYKALDELRSSGDIKAIGLGVNEKEVCLQAMEHGDWDAFLLAGRYTLLEQDPLGDLFPACEKAGTSIILGGPFNSGILAGGENWNYAQAPAHVVEKVRQIRAVCDAHGVPLPAAALQFPLGSSLVSSVIPGPRTQLDMQQILGWFSMKIPASLWTDLQAAELVREDAPLPV